METFPITKKTEEISREKYISKSFRQFLALLLCAAMLMPIFPSPVSATGTTDSTVATDGTEATQEEKAAPEETEPEWVLPECDCGSTEAELGKHGETCALKAFLEKFCEETAAEIYSKWDKLPEECQKYVLEYLGQNPDYAQKLAELNGYIDAAQAATEATEATTEATEATTEATEATTEATEDATEETGMLLGRFGLFASYPDIRVTDAISLPGYPARKVSKTVEYDCGNGVANDGSKSYLTIVTETEYDEFIAYTEILKESGYKLKDKKLSRLILMFLESPTGLQAIHPLMENTNCIHTIFRHIMKPVLSWIPRQILLRATPIQQGKLKPPPSW